MNEFERRLLEITDNHRAFIAALKSMKSNALVEYFGYNKRFDALLNGVTQNKFIALQADAHFVLSYITSAVVLPDTPAGSIEGAMAYPGNVMMQIQDMGSGDMIYSSAMPNGIAGGSISGGSPGIPFLLPTPRIIPPNTNLKIEATQFGVNITNNPEPFAFFVSLIGARVTQV